MVALGLNIHFFFQKKISLPGATRLKAFIGNVFKLEKKKLKRINYIFCSDKYLLKINQEWLGHSFYTDTISFDLSESPKELIGEIYISVDRVKDNANSLKTSFKQELLRVIFHGTLHLCDYKDKNKMGKDKMRNKEEHYLAKYLK